MKNIEQLLSLGILEPLGIANYGQKYIYAGYYGILDDLFIQSRRK